MAVFCISAGQLISKKTGHRIHRRNRYLNYGLLSLASLLHRHGIDALQIQGNFESPKDIFEIAISRGLLATKYPLLLSIPSFYAVSWANEFLTLVKAARPELKVILGGRWVIDDQIEHMRLLIPLADVICRGLGENQILAMVHDNTIGGITMPVNLPPALHSVLNYSLLDQRHIYQPSIEIARGCGMGCSFCQEKSEPLTILKSGQSLTHEASQILLQDNLNKMNLYFETSIFRPTPEWLQSLLLARDIAGHSYYWRTEARVDSIQPKHIPLLYHAGLRVLDLGLESADPNQLINMKKATYPDKYLARAHELIERASSTGILVKVNILLFAGETYQSIQNTIDWLEQRRHMITGVSVGPVIVFGWPHLTSDYLQQLSILGAHRSHDAVLGATHLHLSSEIDYEASEAISKNISRQFMTARNYFRLKSFSYFGRDYSYQEFIADCKIDIDNINFNLTEKCLIE